MPSDRPMSAEIVSVGHELLMGEIVDTNTAFIAQRLSEIGITVRWSGIVGDDMDDLCTAFAQALGRADVLITTGGLGPTSDDMTREAIARVAGEEMAVDPATLEWLEGVFERRGIDMPKTNVKQAMLIRSATTVPNPLGTAPGWWVEQEGRRAILLPGPPRELQRIWSETVGPRLARVSRAGVVATRTLKTAGITEGGIDEMISPLFGQVNPYLGIYARPDGIHLRIIARAETDAGIEKLVRPMEAEIRRILGDAIWGVDDETPGHRAGELLLGRSLTLGAIEGVSAGALAGQMARIPGHADFYRGSLVTALGVDGRRAAALPEDTPAGASESAALGLAWVARSVLGADVGLSITLPAGDGDPEPAGAYRVAIAGPAGEHAKASRVSYTQEVTAQRAATLALVELVAALTSGRV